MLSATRTRRLGAIHGAISTLAVRSADYGRWLDAAVPPQAQHTSAASTKHTSQEQLF